MCSILNVILGLSIFWTHCREYGLGLEDVCRVMCESQANMCGIQNFKGKIEEGFDADFCVWDPEEEFLVSPEIIQFRNKVLILKKMSFFSVMKFFYTIGKSVHEYEITWSCSCNCGSRSARIPKI